MRFIESSAPDLIAFDHDVYGSIAFGVSPDPDRHGVDIFTTGDESEASFRSGEEQYKSLSRDDLESIILHLIETGLYSDRSYAWQIAALSPTMTSHKPRGYIISMNRLILRTTGLKIKLARLLGRSIYTKMEMVDGSIAYEVWTS